MHQPWSFLAADAFHIRVVAEDSVHQRAGRMSRRRVDNHPRRFVDHDQVVVLENNIQRNILRYQTARHRRRDAHFDIIAVVEHLSAFFGSHPVDADKSIRDQALNARA